MPTGLKIQKAALGRSHGSQELFAYMCWYSLEHKLKQPDSHFCPKMESMEAQHLKKIFRKIGNNYKLEEKLKSNSTKHIQPHTIFQIHLPHFSLFAAHGDHGLWEVSLTRLGNSLLIGEGWCVCGHFLRDPTWATSWGGLTMCAQHRSIGWWPGWNKKGKKKEVGAHLETFSLLRQCVLCCRCLGYRYSVFSVSVTNSSWLSPGGFWALGLWRE